MKLRTILLAFLVLPVAGCASVNHTVDNVRQTFSNMHLPSFSSNVPQPTVADTPNGCPPATIISELGAVHQFMDETSTRADSLISSAQIGQIQSSCTVNENNIVVDLTINFTGALGPQALLWQTERRSFAYPYFVAISAADGTIIAKEVFALTVTYEKDEQQRTWTESLRQVIPLQGGYGDQYELLIGFQLTESELAYNRTLLGVTAPAAPEIAVETSPAATAEPTSITIKPAHKPSAPVDAAAAAPEPEAQPVPAPTETAAPAPVPAAMPVAPAPAQPVENAAPGAPQGSIPAMIPPGAPATPSDSAEPEDVTAPAAPVVPAQPGAPTTPPAL
jgi:hypothetical protein